MFKKKNDEKIDFKIVSEDEALWTRIRDARKAAIKQYEEAIIVEREIFALAERKIEALRRK